MPTQYLFVGTIKAALKEHQIDIAKLQVQTQIMDQSLPTMLWQLCYSKISVKTLIPGLRRKLASKSSTETFDKRRRRQRRSTASKRRIKSKTKSQSPEMESQLHVPPVKPQIIQLPGEKMATYQGWTEQTERHSRLPQHWGRIRRHESELTPKFLSTARRSFRLTPSLVNLARVRICLTFKR